MVGTKGFFKIFIIALVFLFFVILLELNDDMGLFSLASDSIAGAFGVPSGSFAGWLALVIVTGSILLVAGGTVTLIKNALETFRE